MIIPCTPEHLIRYVPMQEHSPTHIPPTYLPLLPYHMPRRALTTRRWPTYTPYLFFASNIFTLLFFFFFRSLLVTFACFQRNYYWIIPSFENALGVRPWPGSSWIADSGLI
ncbi:hypothetical protein BOTBODRAFT_546838 [Botryobasidium botryosum FD-172 SS1]|uniref:Uncharacterized protein n=1 Tax=Botryobasidium botryosum (strain FD-172 SS1) TaxID=930990 RepID=A0A067N1J5_BOTB1|nr:hypothetical protein BOTBODRAFT_546838 [Botryobasidium botryosum FD-172 SS1]